MKESFVPLFKECLDIIKREDIKNEIKQIFKPLLDFILYEINPYIYITVALVFLIFVLLVAILFILLLIIRNKQLLAKII
jgi:hypothetical protein